MTSGGSGLPPGADGRRPITARDDERRRPRPKSAADRKAGKGTYLNSIPGGYKLNYDSVMLSIIRRVNPIEAFYNEANTGGMVLGNGGRRSAPKQKAKLSKNITLTYGFNGSTPRKKP